MQILKEKNISYRDISKFSLWQDKQQYINWNSKRNYRWRWIGYDKISKKFPIRNHVCLYDFNHIRT